MRNRKFTVMVKGSFGQEYQQYSRLFRRELSREHIDLLLPHPAVERESVKQNHRSHILIPFPCARARVSQRLWRQLLSGFVADERLDRAMTSPKGRRYSALQPSRCSRTPTRDPYRRRRRLD